MKSECKKVKVMYSNVLIWLHIEGLLLVSTFLEMSSNKILILEDVPAALRS